MQAVAPELQSYLDQVVSTLRDHLGAELIGVYLHGSLAMDAFDPGRSDVDVLAVCAAAIAHRRRMDVGEALASIPRPPPVGNWSSVSSLRLRRERGSPPHPSKYM